MSDQTSLESTVWASELIGAQVLADENQVARVTGLVMFPPNGVLALQVHSLTANESPCSAAQARLLLFDAALSYAPGEVRVASADDMVPAFKLPNLLDRLSTTTLPHLGSPIRTLARTRVGYLWDARLDSVTGELLQYRIGPTPQPAPGARGVLTCCPLCSCTAGELTLPEEDALLVKDLIGQLPRPA